MKNKDYLSLYKSLIITLVVYCLIYYVVFLGLHGFTFLSSIVLWLLLVLVYVLLLNYFSDKRGLSHEN